MSRPLSIAGYASVFGVPFTPSTGGRYMVARGAFGGVAAKVVPLCFGHDERRAFASTYDGSLSIWEDPYGLAVAFDPEHSKVGNGLFAGIARGATAALSVCFRDFGSHVETIAGERVEVITRSGISEISVAAEGACPGARCWPADLDIDELPPHVRNAARRWRVGAQAHSLAAHRRSQSTRPVALGQRSRSSMAALSAGRVEHSPVEAVADFRGWFAARHGGARRGVSS